MEHRRDYNEAELKLIEAGKGDEAKVAWTKRRLGSLPDDGIEIAYKGDGEFHSERYRK